MNQKRKYALPGEIIDLDTFREMKRRVPLYYVGYLPYIGAPKKIDSEPKGARGTHQNVFEDLESARRRYEDLKHSGWVETLELRKGNPGTGMMTSLLDSEDEPALKRFSKARRSR